MVCQPEKFDRPELTDLAGLVQLVDSAQGPFQRSLVVDGVQVQQIETAQAQLRLNIADVIDYTRTVSRLVPLQLGLCVLNITLNSHICRN